MISPQIQNASDVGVIVEPSRRTGMFRGEHVEHNTRVSIFPSIIHFQETNWSSLVAFRWFPRSYSWIVIGQWIYTKAWWSLFQPIGDSRCSSVMKLKYIKIPFPCGFTACLAGRMGEGLLLGVDDTTPELLLSLLRLIASFIWWDQEEESVTSRSNRK